MGINIGERKKSGMGYERLTGKEKGKERGDGEGKQVGLFGKTRGRVR